MTLGQPRIWSFTEVVTLRVIGTGGKLLFVALLAWLSGTEIPSKGYAMFGIGTLLFSLVWGYCGRRVFNWLSVRSNMTTRQNA